MVSPFSLPIDRLGCQLRENGQSGRGMKNAAIVAILASLGCTPRSSSSAAPVASATPGAAPDARATDHFATASGPLDVTPLNHASVLFAWAGKAIYVDPTMVALAAGGLPKADVIFVTDIHPDHLDFSALERLRQDGTRVVGPPAVAEKTHVDVVMKNGDASDVEGISVEAIPMYNLTRGPLPGKLFHDKGRGNGYVLGFGGSRVYLSGDTECTSEMRELQRIDVAFVCMNLPFTMPPAEAIPCIEAFHPKVLFPYHYRGSDLSELHVLADQGIDVRLRAWY
jgi:L-ascorbate metabolism protein UlaG (beta-lactamase superfamily)